MSPLELAKERLSIPDLAALLGWDWRPGKSCRVPWRPDRQPSASVFSNGQLLKDHSSGDLLDAPALLARMEDLSPAEACRRFIALAGVKPGEAAPLPRPTPRRASPEPARTKPRLPLLTAPSREEIETVAQLRGLGAEGVAYAAARGFLWIATIGGRRCWALTDAARWLCQLRPLDGEPFVKGDGTTYKARTCRGCWGAWPLGVLEVGTLPSVAFVEGGGDFLAACHFITAEACKTTCAPVAMLGAAHKIPALVLPHFAGKRVRIFAHVDPPNDRGERPGYEAAARWEAQLEEAGAHVTTFDLSDLRQTDGSPVGDLNDLARISAEDFEADPQLSAVVTF